jgi:CheY-like chemotaxis protein
MNLKETKAKILLADDDDEVLAALGSVLISEGYEVIFAKDGREAIERFREEQIDVALLDLNMPVKGGWEAFERLPSALADNPYNGAARSISIGTRGRSRCTNGKAVRFAVTAADDRRAPSRANGKASGPANWATADHPIPSCRSLISLKGKAGSLNMSVAIDFSDTVH